MPITISPEDKGSPLEGRPFWIDFASNDDLFYLGWGKRFFGKRPLMVTRHTGWEYVVILRGTPSLDLTDCSVQLKKHSVLIIHPNCASGWSDRLGATCEVLYWIWLRPPDSTLSPQDAGFRIGIADPVQLARLDRLHTECRREVQLADGLSCTSLSGLRMQLNAEFARAFSIHRTRSQTKTQFALASRWFERNLARRGAIALLCEYLDMSSATLGKLFQQHAHCTPAQYYGRLRMQRAKQLVREDRLSGKAAAFELGYAHSSDLSRAFRRQTGKCLVRRARTKKL